MEYTNADVFVYQILDCLVSEYNYQIVNVPRNKKDIWLACESNSDYPMIRLSSICSSSAIFEQDYLSKIKGALSSLLNIKKPLLIINTHSDSKEYVEEEITQIIMTDERISDNNILKIFPLLSQVLKKVENGQEECAKLTRHLESIQMSRLKEARKFKWADAPKMTISIFAVIMVIYLLMVIFLSSGTKNWLSTMIVGGGYYKALVVYGGEYWRLLTTGFIHLDIIYVLFYGMALFQLGKVCEKIYPTWRYLIIFFGSMLVGNIFVLVFASNVVSAGMGGGLLGVLGALFVYMWESKVYRNKLMRMRLTQLIMLTVLASFFNGISAFGIIGGLLAGLFLAIIVHPKDSFKPYRKHFAICGAIMVGMLCYFGYNVNSAYPQYSDLDKQIVKDYRNLGLNDYADHIEGYLNKAYKE